MKENAVRRANDPKRREKIIQATLEAVKTYGVHAVTHRKIAAIAQVPLGSMTYYFAGMDALLSEAFTLFTENMSRQYQDFFAQVTDAEGACQAITEMIYGSQVTTPDNMALMYQLYAYASDKPALKIPEINALATLILGVVGIVGFIAWYLMARAEKQRIRDIQRARRG